MRKIKDFAVRLWKDERGASLLEYSVLIGIITATTIGIVVFAGGWVQGQWAALQTNLTNTGTPGQN